MTVLIEDSLSGSLVGKFVIGIDVADREEAVRLRCSDSSPVIWETDADCCSETWFADGFQLSALREATVAVIKTLDLPGYDVEDGRTRQEYDQVYGYQITTDRGAATLAFRNSSNGYYGGDVIVGTDGGYEWREITGNDWRA